jgi:hypothetical protein
MKSQECRLTTSHCFRLLFHLKRSSSFVLSLISLIVSYVNVLSCHRSSNHLLSSLSCHCWYTLGNCLLNASPSTVQRQTSPPTTTNYQCMAEAHGYEIAACNEHHRTNHKRSDLRRQNIADTYIYTCCTSQRYPQNTRLNTHAGSRFCGLCIHTLRSSLSVSICP